MRPIHLIVGSQQGNTEALADDLAEHLTSLDFEITVHEQPEYDDIPQQNALWLVSTSTFGAGDYPDNIQPFIDTLSEKQPDLSTIQYAVIAVGDTSYDTFCLAGANIDQQLASLKAQKLAERLEICMVTGEDPYDLAIDWLTNWLIKQQ